MEFDWLHSGIPFHIPGNGGPQCIGFLPVTQRVVETLLHTSLSLILLYSAIKHLQPVTIKIVPPSLWRSALLASFSLVFGVEVGFKLASNQVVWLLNPCHVLTMIQLLLLLLPVTPTTAALYRLQLYWLTGPLLALIFPVTDSLLFNGEVKIYWIQHLLLLVAPLPLLSQSVEPTADWTWPVLAFSLYSLFHWLVLQPMSLLSGANLNNMMCPPVSAPELLSGPYYRNLGMLHQALLVPLVGKMYPLIVSYLSSLRGRHINLNNNKED